MRKQLLSLGLICMAALAGRSQTIAYFGPIHAADSLRMLKQYEKAAVCYDRALPQAGMKIRWYDWYNAACIYALAGDKDKAFRTADRLVREPHFYYGKDLLADKDLSGLHRDKRWAVLRAALLRKDSLAAARFNKPLKVELDSIFDKDQRYRRQLNSVSSQYGDNSPQMDQLEEKMGIADSENVVQVMAILDRYGWLSPDSVGGKGCSALWAVIQHADVDVQKRYLPMLRKAVAAGNVEAAELALLEDRILTNQDQPQIYGTQVKRNAQGVYQPLPIADSAGVDRRRAAVGLEPLRFYLMSFQ